MNLNQFTHLHNVIFVKFDELALVFFATFSGRSLLMITVPAHTLQNVQMTSFTFD